MALSLLLCKQLSSHVTSYTATHCRPCAHDVQVRLELPVCGRSQSGNQVMYVLHPAQLEPSETYPGHKASAVCTEHFGVHTMTI